MNLQKKYLMIRCLKGISGEQGGAVFPIRHKDLSIIGYMRVVNSSIIQNDELIATMASARTKYQRSFLTQFDATPENKRNWLLNQILKNDTRILFLIEAEDHTVVGQDGFTILSENVFVLDGTMRWILKYGHKDLYVRCGIERAAICFFLLQCKLSTTEVFADNIANVKNSLKMGHKIQKEYSLFLSEKNKIFTYSKIKESSQANTDRKLLSFTMTRERFIEIHPEIACNPSWLLPEFSLDSWLGMM